MSDDADENETKRSTAQRQQRLRQALRENLKRRKAQARGRVAQGLASNCNEPAEED